MERSRDGSRRSVAPAYSSCSTSSPTYRHIETSPPEQEKAHPPFHSRLCVWQGTVWHRLTLLFKAIGLLTGLCHITFRGVEERRAGCLGWSLYNFMYYLIFLAFSSLSQFDLKRGRQAHFVLRHAILQTGTQSHFLEDVPIPAVREKERREKEQSSREEF